MTELHKDLVYKSLERDYRQLLKSERTKTVYWNLFLRALNLVPVGFLTLDELKTEETARSEDKQPLFVSGNLDHVIRLANKERRDLELFGSICPIGTDRILLTDDNLSYDLFHLPKEFDPTSLHNLDRSRCRIDISNIEREPSIGKVLKFFKYFSIASKFDKPITFFMATNEYLLAMKDVAEKLGINTNSLESAVNTCELKFRKTIENIRNRYFPHVNSAVLASTDHDVKSYIDTLSSSEELIELTNWLGEHNLSCARLLHGKTERILENERRYENCNYRNRNRWQDHRHQND